MRTWHAEIVFVWIVLFTVAGCAGGGYIEMLGALAVLLSFAHAQVADRLAEREGARAQAAVECHRWATRYLVSKEACWLVYFVAHRSWSALAGVVLFLLYPVWRRAYRRRYPLEVA